MLRIVLAIVLILLLGDVLSSYGQNQIMAIPTQYIPGFAGSLNKARIAFYSGIGSKSPQGNMKRTHYKSVLSFDKFYKAGIIGLGLGIQGEVLNDPFLPASGQVYLPQAALDMQYDSTYLYQKGYSVQGSASLKLSGMGKYTFAPFISLKYGHYRNIALLSSSNYPAASLGNSIEYTFNQMIVSTGALFTTYDYQLGFNLILRDRLSYPSTHPYPGYLSYLLLQASAIFQSNPNSRLAFVPVLLLKIPLKESILDPYIHTLINLNFTYQRLILGLIPALGSLPNSNDNAFRITSGILAGYRTKDKNTRVQFSWSPRAHSYRKLLFNSPGQQFEISLQRNIKNSYKI